MERRQQIIYMQVRLVRKAAEAWGVPIDGAVKRLAAFQVPQYIEDNYDLLHMEGDEAIFADITQLMERRGAMADAATC